MCAACAEPLAPPAAIANVPPAAGVTAEPALSRNVYQYPPRPLFAATWLLSSSASSITPSGGHCLPSGVFAAAEPDVGAPRGMHPAHPTTPAAHTQGHQYRFIETFPWSGTLPPHARLELQH